MIKQLCWRTLFSIILNSALCSGSNLDPQAPYPMLYFIFFWFPPQANANYYFKLGYEHFHTLPIHYFLLILAFHTTQPETLSYMINKLHLHIKCHHCYWNVNGKGISVFNSASYDEVRRSGHDTPLILNLSTRYSWAVKLHAPPILTQKRESPKYPTGGCQNQYGCCQENSLCCCLASEAVA